MLVITNAFGERKLNNASLLSPVLLFPQGGGYLSDQEQHFSDQSEQGS